MEVAALSILTADLNAQLVLIDTVYNKVEVRAVDLEATDEIRLESLAYQIHNFYNAIEELLKLVATRFENQITDTAQWHSALLQRMTQPVQGIRPALLSPESYLLLNSLRSFRHFFRHAYGVPLDYAQLLANLERTRAVRSQLHQDVQSFLATLQFD